MTGPAPQEREQRLVFGEVAETYDKQRSSYPSHVIDGILAFAGLQRDTTTPVAEVGAGTGKASVLFAARGIALECLEPSPEMAAVARRHLAQYENAEVLDTSFEQWRPAEHAYGLVFAAQAWHWVSPEGRYAKLYSALRTHGSFAAVWNTMLGHGNKRLEKALAKAYGDLLVGRQRLTDAERAGVNDWVMREIEESGLFEPGSPTMLREPWHRSFDTEGWLELLSTQSDHRMLDKETRDRLFEQIAAAIDVYGGAFEAEYVTVTYLARTLGRETNP